MKGIRLLNIAKKDERKAPGEYLRLMKQLKSAHDKRIVKGIISDERRHLRLLKNIRRLR